MQGAAFENAMAPARKLLELAGLGLAATEVRLVGNNPGDQIAAYATKNKLDLMALGSHGHGNLRNLVMGLIATKVLASCKVPVLLVR